MGTVASAPASKPRQGDTVARFHEFRMTSITGETVDLSQFEGTVCLVVNVASR